MTDMSLLARVRNFLRAEEGDPTLPGLVDAAEQYLSNAGVVRPASSDTKATEQYALAVSLYVSTIWSGGESKLDAAMTAIILQMR